jgi:uncharacterized protein with PIN domain
MRFLCDEMLNRLARWLRAAGYDTALAETGTSDRELLRLAVNEQRRLITRDRKLLEHRHEPGTIVLLLGNSVDECVAELSRKLGIDWLHDPFTRCMECNTPLIPASPEQAQRIPPEAKQVGTEVRYCPACDQLFWSGSHVRRMRRRLQHWTEGR